MYFGKSMYTGFIDNKDDATAMLTKEGGGTTTVRMYSNSNVGRYISAADSMKIYKVVGYR